jgi:UDP-N-acetylglucosamine 2-epimerase (non-hydrolysing)
MKPYLGGRPGILVVVGTRPEAIKMAPLIRRLKASPDFTIRVCSTGQHREMIRQVFELFSITPDIDLDIMQADQKLNGLVARVVVGMEAVLTEYRPWRVLVHGDTTTTAASAMAAYHLKIPVGHVEAGLRTRDIYSPWPEEMNRRIADVIADRLYAPTDSARENLLAEGVEGEKITVTGNTVIDALLDIVSGPLSDANVQERLRRQLPFFSSGKKTILVTCHRRESYGQGFQNVCSALQQLAKRGDVQIVFPIHRNPNVRAVFSTLEAESDVTVIEPLDYLEFVYALSKSDVILTDSGGVQEEAPSLGKPVLVMRETTERPEAIHAGTAKLVGTDTSEIISTTAKLLEDSAMYESMSTVHNPYGDGRACERIIASLMKDVERAASR